MSDQHYTVEQLLELAHKHKALHIKVGPLEVELSPSAFESAAGPQTPTDIPEAEKVPNAEEMLYLASPLEYVPGGN